VLVGPPAQVVLRFDESVSTVVGSVRVFDGEARRVDTGEVTKPASDTVAVGLPGDLPDGTYTVAWRVLSADSHPIRGAFVFAVGKAVGDGKGVADRVLDAGAGSPWVDWALTLVRFVGLALILLCVGGAAVLAFVAEEQDSRTTGVWRTLAAAGVLLALDSLAWIALTGVKAAGFGLDAVFRWPLLRDVLDTGFGQVWVARGLLGVVLAGVALLAVRRGSEALVASGLFLASAIAVTPALSGHARVEGSLAILSDSVHVLAAGVWVGGLAFLALLLVKAGGDRWSLATKVVPRFSTLAVASVIALVAAGVVSSILELGSLSGLWETTYGRLLLAKVALLLPLVALGAYNNRVSVPRLRGADPGPQVRRRFARIVAAELALLVVVVGVTAVLVAEPPAKAQPAAADGVASRDGRVGPYRYTLTVDPAGTGPNEIHVYLLDSTGALAPVDEIAVSATLPAVDVGPLRFEATPAGPGHGVVTGAELTLAGDWQLQLDVRKGEFDQWSTTTDIPIRKDS
jgi:copper transport protein